MSAKHVNDSQQETAAAREKPSMPAWLVVACAVSLVCMLASACVVGFALFTSPDLPDSSVAEKKRPADEDELKKIDAELAHYKQLIEDAKREVDQQDARFRLEQEAAFVRVAAIQFASEFGNLTKNRERLIALTRKAAGNGARIIVMPECALPGYMSVDHQTAWRDPVRRPNPKDGRSIVEAGVADTVPGENTKRFGGLAKEMNVYVAVTLIEKVEKKVGDKATVDYFNTAVLMGPDGEIACHYRKLNLWPPGDATWAQSGDLGLGLCETPFGKLGLLICYDLTSGVVDKLKAAGADMVLYPVGWVHPKPPADWFEEMLPEKVKEWGVPLIAANWSVERLPENSDASGYGFSTIYAANGRQLAGAGPDGTKIIYADLLRVARKTE